MDRRILGLAALLGASMAPLGAELIERGPQDYNPTPPRARRVRDDFDMPRWARRRAKKAAAAARERIRKAGIPGNKLARKGGGGGRVRGW